MTRKGILFILVAVGLLVLLMALPAMADWPLYRNDAANTGKAGCGAPANNTLLYSSADLQVRDGTGVCVSDGMAYLFTVPDPWPPDPAVKSKIAAVNALDGALIWDKELESAGGMGSWANPVCDKENVFIGCGTTLFCMDKKTGAAVWNQALPQAGGVDAVINHTPLLAEDKAFVGDYNSGYYYGLDTADGSIDWQYDLGAGNSAQGAPAYASGWVILTRSASFGNPAAGMVACVSASDPGSVAWTVNTDYDVPGSPAVDVAGGLVYVGDFAYGGPQSNLYCFKLSDGSQVWKQAIWGTSGAPALDGGGKVFVAGNDSNTGTNHTYCFDAANGNPAWNTAGWGAYNANCAVSTDGKVLVGSMSAFWTHDAGIAALKVSDGSVIWSTAADGGGNPVISGGVVYTTAAGKLHAYSDVNMIDWYFAEGYTGDGFEEWLCLANFDNRDAAVNVTYIFSDADPLIRNYTVPAQRRLTLYINQEVGPDKEVSVLVQAIGTVIAERPMYFDYQGTNMWGWKGGHDASGVDEPLNEWYFAEGYTGDGFEEWLCMANFSGDTAEVTVTYLYTDSAPLQEIYYIPPHRRVTFNVNLIAGAGRDISIGINSNRPVVAERPMYFLYKGVWDGGHDISGIRPQDIN